MISKHLPHLLFRRETSYFAISYSLFLSAGGVFFFFFFLFLHYNKQNHCAKQVGVFQSETLLPRNWVDTVFGDLCQKISDVMVLDALMIMHATSISSITITRMLT